MLYINYTYNTALHMVQWFSLLFVAITQLYKCSARNTYIRLAIFISETNLILKY